MLLTWTDDKRGAELKGAHWISNIVFSAVLLVLVLSLKCNNYRWKSGAISQASFSFSLLKSQSTISVGINWTASGAATLELRSDLGAQPKDWERCWVVTFKRQGTLHSQDDRIRNKAAREGAVFSPCKSPYTRRKIFHVWADNFRNCKIHSVCPLHLGNKYHLCLLDTELYQTYYEIINCNKPCLLYPKSEVIIQIGSQSAVPAMIC